LAARNFEGEVTRRVAHEPARQCVTVSSSSLRTREEHRFVPVLPPDAEVRNAAALDHVEDLALARRVTRAQGIDHDLVTDLGIHVRSLQARSGRGFLLMRGVDQSTWYANSGPFDARTRARE
jgi:hypothetical protein